MILQRRQFIRRAIGCGAALALGRPLAALAAGDAAAPVRRQAIRLGTTVSITAAHASPAHARRAIDAAFDELDLVEAIMSLYRADSQLCQLNRDGRLDDAHPHLLAVLSHAAAMSRMSGGAFDVTVQPLWELHADNRATDPAELDRARGSVDWRGVRIDGRRVSLRPGQRVTLNGIAQGFAADRVVAVLRDHGIEHALIDTGELAAVGTRTDGQPWSAGVQHPRVADAYVSVAALADRCLATSGDYATRVGRGHHLFDPATGRSAEALASVSVAAPSAMQADALSTAAFVLGPDRAIDLIVRVPGADLLMVLPDNTVRATAGFPGGEA